MASARALQGRGVTPVGSWSALFSRRIMREFRACAVLIAWAAVSQSAVVYTGDFCAGVVDFPLEDGTDIAELDEDAAALFGPFPRWVSKSCSTALWKFSCMDNYGKAAADGQGYCRNSCLATLTGCDSTIELLGEDDAAPYVAYLQIKCASASTSASCHEGGEVSYEDVPEEYGVFCPKPLGLVEHRPGLHVQKIEGSACALPCPPISFTHEEWFTLRDVAKWCSFASVILSAIVTLSHREEKNVLVRYLNIGSIIMNAMIFSFLWVDEYNPQICVDDIYYEKATPFCLATAITTVAGYSWLFGWQACIALHLWLSVVVQVKRGKLDEIKAYFLPSVAAFSLLCPIICASVGNLGYDWTGLSGPICLFLVSEDDSYFWALFFSPIVVVIVTCLALMVHTIFHVNTVVGAASGAQSAPAWARFVRMFKLNRRMFLFVGCFCLFGLYQTVSILDDKFFDPRNFTKSAIDFVRCLLTNAGTDPNTGREVCGDVPTQRPYLWRVSLLITYSASIGILSFTVYGTQNKMSHSVSQGLQSLRSTIVADGRSRGNTSAAAPSKQFGRSKTWSHSKRRSASTGNEPSDSISEAHVVSPIEAITKTSSVADMIDDDHL